MATVGVPIKEITLAFTDIEGSTRLLHELGDAYLDVLDVHHQRVRRAVARHNGAVVRTEGDSFFLAFDDPASAVAACLDAQLALGEDGWPHGRPVRVRMGIHHGAVAALDVDGARDYIGLPVHEAARVTEAATGGVVVLTDAVASAVADALPDGAVLEDLGLHLLRDFPAPCRLFAVSHPDLPMSVSPLRLAPAGSSTLPAPPTPLVARHDELHRLAALVLGTARLVTVVGPGGVGKTRLALEAAWSIRSRFAAGPWFVDLAAITSAEGVTDAILATVAPAPDSGDTFDAVCAALAREPALLVLDNFEQVADGASVVARLIEACPQLRVVVTSRERLRLRAEHVVLLEGLAVDDAVALLRERAEASGARLEGMGTDAASEALCVHLGGLPLAIELAAARLDELSVPALLEQLRGGLDSLSDGPVDLPARQRALRTTIEWSVDLLGDDERRVFESLAVFAGGAALPEVERVARALGAVGSVEDAIAALIDKSLVRPADGKPDRPRVAVQEVVRQFAEEQLRRDDIRWSAAVRAHLAAVTALVQLAEPHLDAAEQATWLDALAYDHDNVRVALERAPAEAALPLVLALPPFWTSRGHWSEARRFLTRALASDAAEADGWAVAKLHAALGYFSERLGDIASADTHARAALRIGERLGHRDLCARAANTLGDVAASADDVAAAQGWYEKAIGFADEIDDKNHRAVALSNLGVLAWQHGRGADARRYWHGALALAEELSQARSVVILNNNLGLIDRLDGDLDAAEARFRTCLETAEELADPMPIADAYLNLGVVAKDRGDEAAARDLYMEALTIYERLGYVRYAAVALLHLAMATDELSQARGWAQAARVRAAACGDHMRLGECDSILATLAQIEQEMTEP